MKNFVESQNRENTEKQGYREKVRVLLRDIATIPTMKSLDK